MLMGDEFQDAIDFGAHDACACARIYATAVYTPQEEICDTMRWWCHIDAIILREDGWMAIIRIYIIAPGFLKSISW